MSNHIISKAKGLKANVPLSAALVMDIPASSQKDYVIPQVWPKDSPDAQNQLWEFPADPSAPGYFHIKSALDGSHLSTPSGWPTFQNVVADRPTNVEDDRFRWRAVQDPNDSGFCYLQNKLLGLVIGTQNGSHDEGTILVMVNPVLGHDSQLWQAPFPDVVGVPTESDHLNLGSGTGYFGSDGAKCTVVANLTMKSDGSCRYWGQYENCGDVPLATAPPQNFGMTLVVHDLVVNWYSFTVGAFANDLQKIPWDDSGTSSYIRENWVSIALSGQCSISLSNEEANTDENSAAADQNLRDIEGRMQIAATSAGGGSITGFEPNIIYQDILAYPPYLTVESGGGGEAGGSFPAGWQPSGAVAVPAR